MDRLAGGKVATFILCCKRRYLVTSWMPLFASYDMRTWAKRMAGTWRTWVRSHAASRNVGPWYWRHRMVAVFCPWLLSQLRELVSCHRLGRQRSVIKKAVMMRSCRNSCVPKGLPRSCLRCKRYGPHGLTDASRSSATYIVGLNWLSVVSACFNQFVKTFTKELVK